MSIKTQFLLSTEKYFHVYNRGVNRNTIFFNDRNYEYFRKLMLEYLDPAAIEIIAYCLMPNHYHFILFQKQENGISQYIKAVCNSYVKAINKERSRSGHLFEGKYRIKLIESDEYLLHLSRYIHLNPVRANLVMKEEDWDFSSCKEYYGIRVSEQIATQFVLIQAGNLLQYREFIKQYNRHDKEKINRYLFN